MAQQIQRIRIEEIDWLGALPWLRIFGSFGMSIRPSRLLMGLIMIGLLFGGAEVLDRINGPTVSSVLHIRQYALLSPQALKQWQAQYELDTQSHLYTMLTSLPGSAPGIADKVKGQDRLDFAAQTINEHFDRERKLLTPPSAEPAEPEDDTQTPSPENDSDSAPDGTPENNPQEADPNSPDSPDNTGKEQEAASTDTEPNTAKSDSDAQVAKMKAEAAEAAKAAKAAADEEAELYALQVAQLEFERKQMLQVIDQLRPRGVFETAMIFKFDALKRLVGSTLARRGGISTVVSGKRPHPNSVLGAIYDLCVVLPKWFFGRHTMLALIWIIYVLLIWSVLGGAISRMAALQATRGLNIGPLKALKFVIRRWFTYLAVFIEPLLVVALMAGLLALGGLLFNWPGTDVLAALLYGFALLLGFMAVMVMVVLGAAAHLMHPAVSVESSDSFDTVSRSFNYILGRPWRWLFYNFVSVLYGAVTIGFVWCVVALVVTMTHRFVDLGSFSSLDEPSRFASIYPQSNFGQFQYEVPWRQLDGSGRVAACIMVFWTYLMGALVLSYIVNFNISASTWIYLLLRRSTDGEAMDVVFDDDLKPEIQVESKAETRGSDRVTPPAEQQQSPDASSGPAPGPVSDPSSSSSDSGPADDPPRSPETDPLPITPPPSPGD